MSRTRKHVATWLGNILLAVAGAVVYRNNDWRVWALATAVLVAILGLVVAATLVCGWLQGYEDGHEQGLREGRRW